MSIAPFSPLEIQLIRASLSTKTTQEICELLERSVEDVTELLNDITDGKAEDREHDVMLYIEEKAVQKKSNAGRPITRSAEVREAEKKRKKESSSIEESRKKKRLEAERGWEAQRAEYRKRDDQRKYKTIQRDWSKTKSIKLDDKTWVLVEIQETQEKTDLLIKKAKANYDANKILNQYKSLNQFKVKTT